MLIFPFIILGDVSSNDGIPRFLKPEPNEVAYVPENSSAGTKVSDLGLLGKVVYNEKKLEVRIFRKLKIHYILYFI